MPSLETHATQSIARDHTATTRLPRRDKPPSPFPSLALIVSYPYRPSGGET